MKNTSVALHGGNKQTWYIYIISIYIIYVMIYMMYICDIYTSCIWFFSLNQPPEYSTGEYVFNNINIQKPELSTIHSCSQFAWEPIVSLAPKNSKHKLRLLYQFTMLKLPQLTTGCSVLICLEDLACFWALSFKINPNKLEFLHLRWLKTTLFEKLATVGDTSLETIKYDDHIQVQGK